MSDPSAQSSREAYTAVDDGFTVSKVVEKLGLTPHHYYLIAFVSLTWTFYGWSSTLMVYTLDAAGEDSTQWTQLTSAEDKLSVQDKSFCLLLGGFLSVIGTPGLSLVSDVFGRVLAMELGVLGTVAGMFACALVRSRAHLMFLMIVYTAGGPPLITQALLSEWLPAAWRGILSTSLHAWWNVGRLAMTVLWVFLPPSEHWMAFFFAAAMPVLVLAVFTGLRGWRYESPRVLAVKGDAEGCAARLQLAAESQTTQETTQETTQDPSLLRMLGDPRNLRLADGSGEELEIQQLSWKEQLSELLIPELRSLVVLLGVIGFSIAFASAVLYIWFMEYLKAIDMSAAIQPTMMAAPIGKIFSNILLVIGGRGDCIIDWCPLRVVMQVGFLGCAACITGFLLSHSVVQMTTVMFACEVFEEFVWTAVSIYIIEAFPTTVRNSATGVIGAVIAIGNIAGSCSGGPLMQIHVHLPILTMIATCVLGAVTSFLLTSERFRGTLMDTALQGKVFVGNAKKLAADSYGSCQETLP